MARVAARAQTIPDGDEKEVVSRLKKAKKDVRVACVRACVDVASVLPRSLCRRLPFLTLACAAAGALDENQEVDVTTSLANDLQHLLFALNSSQKRNTREHFAHSVESVPSFAFASFSRTTARTTCSSDAFSASASSSTLAVDDSTSPSRRLNRLRVDAPVRGGCSDAPSADHCDAHTRHTTHTHVGARLACARHEQLSPIACLDWPQ
jgi:hypothetical protein